MRGTVLEDLHELVQTKGIVRFLDSHCNSSRGCGLPITLKMGMINIPQTFLPALPSPLVALGTIWVSRILLQIASFTWLHFLRPRSRALNRYKQTSADQEPWAIVTGASDGIGKAFAEELADQGFNVVLHGRNEEKLLGVRATLQRQWPDRQFKILILDVIHDQNEVRMQTAIDSVKHLPIKILINNVGGNANQPPLSARDQSYANSDAMLDVNARFPMQFTRMLLPQLIEQQPTLVLNIGSGVGVGDLAIPFLTVYCGAKAALPSWSRSLQIESNIEGYGIESIAIVVGGVTTARKQQAASLFEPSARDYARASLGVAGSGYRVVWAYWFHDLIFGFVGRLPARIIEMMMTGLGKELLEEEAQKLKK